MAIVTVTDWLATEYPGKGESLEWLGAAGLEDHAVVVERTSGLYTLDADYGGIQQISGSGFTYDASGNLTGGVVTGWDELWGSWEQRADHPLATRFSIAGLSLPATALGDLVDHGDLNRAPLIFAGDDWMTGSSGGDTLWGYAGNDTIAGSNDAALDDGSNYLRGGDGDDELVGGRGFDNINGNTGNDWAYGGPGDDWVVGGKDDDTLYGDSTPWDYDSEGSDIVLGNLGNDTLDGGGGDDTVRGGQGDDEIHGEAGDDWLSGDRGNDTITGWAGADTFHTFGEAGIDRVVDFNRAEGDRVQLDPGTTYTVSQAGADVVIDMAGGAQMVLVGVSMGSLTDGWIFAA